MKQSSDHVFLINDLQTSSTLEIVELLHLPSEMENSSDEIQFIPEDDELVFQEVSPVVRDIEDTTDENSENLSLPNEMTVQKL